MALIPSESLNFPDSFRASVGWRVTAKSPPPAAPPSRRTEPNREKNGEGDNKEAPVDRPPPPSSPTVSTVEPADGHSPPAEDKAFEKPERQEESKSELEQPKEAVKAEEAKEVAQEKLVTKPAESPKITPAPPVETKPEQPRDVMPEPSPNITPSPAGATLTGADAAALLNKIFFSPTAASSDLEAIKSQTQSPESPAEPVTSDTTAAAKSSTSAAPVSSESAPEPDKELTKKFTKPIEPARKEFSISPQPTSPLSEGFHHDEPPNTIKIETAAQTKQVLDLIAAAAARGVISAEPIPAAPPVTPPAPEKSAAEVAPAPTAAVTKVETPEPQKVSNVIAPVAGPSVLKVEVGSMPSPGTTLPSAEETSIRPAPSKPNIEPPAPATLEQPLVTATSQPVPKTPAKIRIQPRKIKPRPVTPPTEEGLAEPEIAGPEIDIPDSVALAPVGADNPSLAAPLPKEEAPRKPAYREWAESGMPLPPRSDLNEPSGELFTARDARNRWIRFGSGEFAAVAVFVLLLSYAVTHKFPDPTLKLLIFILMFAVGALAIALPVVFIRNHPSRWQRRALNYRRDHENYF